MSQNSEGKYIYQFVKQVASILITAESVRMTEEAGEKQEEELKGRVGVLRSSPSDSI